MPKPSRAAAVLGAVLMSLSSAVSAASLPAPYVSRALDAVLIPIDGAVREAFGLSGSESGVLILAVAPDGVADAAGLMPGDVIEKAHGHVIADPITLDEVVYHWILQGMFDFGFDGWRGGASSTYAMVITLESYASVIDITTVSTWESYSSESFSYSEYTSEYASEMSESYESSESLIEEAASSEDFESEAALDEAMAEDAAGQEQMAEDIAADEATADDSAADDAGGDEAAADEGGGDEGAADEGGGDEGGDDGGGDAVEE